MVNLSRISLGILNSIIILITNYILPKQIEFNILYLFDLFLIDYILCFSSYKTIICAMFIIQKIMLLHHCDDLIITVVY